jgi:hypothetical protein
MTAAMMAVHKCGWCITGDHDHCKVVTTYDDKEWRCECSCRKDGGK